MELRGKEREKSLSNDRYYSDGYFDLVQLCSQSHQINEIHKLRPASIIEIGIGNGFTSSFLKRAGYDVTTVDINQNLKPDICAPLDRVGEILGGTKYDLVVCCEVLEHMPLADFHASLACLDKLGRRLFLTLPNYRASVGLGGFLRVPKIGITPFDFTVDLPRKKRLEKEHFWEVGSHPVTSRKNIVKKLREMYETVHVKRFELNPYHIAFICTR